MAASLVRGFKARAHEWQPTVDRPVPPPLLQASAWREVLACAPLPSAASPRVSEDTPSSSSAMLSSTDEHAQPALVAAACAVLARVVDEFTQANSGLAKLDARELMRAIADAVDVLVLGRRLDEADVLADHDFTLKSGVVVPDDGGATALFSLLSIDHTSAFFVAGGEAHLAFAKAGESAVKSGEDFSTLHSSVRHLLLTACLTHVRKQKLQVNHRKVFQTFTQKMLRVFCSLWSLASESNSDLELSAALETISGNSLFSNSHTFAELTKFLVGHGSVTSVASEKRRLINRSTDSRKSRSNGGQQDVFVASLIDDLGGLVSHATEAGDAAALQSVWSSMNLFLRQFAVFRERVHKLPRFWAVESERSAQSRKRALDEIVSLADPQVSLDFAMFLALQTIIGFVQEQSTVHSHVASALRGSTFLLETLNEPDADGARIYTADNDVGTSTDSAFSHLLRLLQAAHCVWERTRDSQDVAQAFFGMCARLLDIEHRLFSEDTGANILLAVWRDVVHVGQKEDLRGSEAFCARSVSLYAQLRQLDVLIFDIWGVGSDHELDVSDAVQLFPALVSALELSVSNLPPLQAPVIFDRLRSSLSVESSRFARSRLSLFEIICSSVAISSTSSAEQWAARALDAERTLVGLLDTLSPPRLIKKKSRVVPTVLTCLRSVIRLRIHGARFFVGGVSDQQCVEGFLQLFLRLISMPETRIVTGLAETALLYVEMLRGHALEQTFADVVWTKIASALTTSGKSKSDFLTAVVPHLRAAFASSWVPDGVASCLHELVQSATDCRELMPALDDILLHENFFESPAGSSVIFKSCVGVLKAGDNEHVSFEYLRVLARNVPFQSFRTAVSSCPELVDPVYEYCVAELQARIGICDQPTGLEFFCLLLRLIHRLQICVSPSAPLDLSYRVRVETSIKAALTLALFSSGGTVTESIAALVECSYLVLGEYPTPSSDVSEAYGMFQQCSSWTLVLREQVDKPVLARARAFADELLNPHQSGTTRLELGFQSVLAERIFISGCARLSNALGSVRADNESFIRRVFEYAIRSTLGPPSCSLTELQGLVLQSRKLFENLLLHSDLSRDQLMTIITWCKEALSIDSLFTLEDVNCATRISGALTAVTVLFTRVRAKSFKAKRSFKAELVDRHKLTLLTKVAMAATFLANEVSSALRNAVLQKALEACLLVAKAATSDAHGGVTMSFVLSVINEALHAVKMAPFDDDTDGRKDLFDGIYWCMNAVLTCEDRAVVVQSAASISSKLRELLGLVLQPLVDKNHSTLKPQLSRVTRVARLRATQVARLLELFASQPQFAKYCVYLLVDVVAILHVAQADLSSAGTVRSRAEVFDALSGGVHALFGALDEREFSHCFVCIPSPPEKSLFRRLHNDWSQEHKFSGKV